MYQNDPVKVLTGEVRLSYLTVTTPRAAQPGEEAKYSVRLMIPKNDLATKADIDASIYAAAQAAVTKVWDGVHPPKINMPIYDGDGEKPNGGPYEPECRGHWIINASTKMKPQVVGIDNINADLSPNDIYSGMHWRVTIRFFGYANRGNKGIGCGLGNILKTRDDEPLAGNASAASDFATVGNSVLTPPAIGGAMPAIPGFPVPSFIQPPVSPAYAPAAQPAQAFQVPPQPEYQQAYQQPAPAYPQPQQPYSPQQPVNINPLTGQPL